jgi:outer membrane protein OmpA-like peptidoglycan-associated protein
VNRAFEEDKMRLIPKQVTVFHFPRHSAEIDGLPQEEKAKMNVLAAEIADGLVLGKSPILAFIIIGHADRDPQGTDFEMQVSIKRAEVAQAWLMQEARALVQQRGGDTSELNLVEFSLFGYGASDPYTQDPTFPAREMNRRIVIKYAAVELDPLPDAIGYAPNLARAVTAWPAPLPVLSSSRIGAMAWTAVAPEPVLPAAAGSSCCAGKPTVRKPLGGWFAQPV